MAELYAVGGRTESSNPSGPPLPYSTHAPRGVVFSFLFLFFLLVALSWLFLFPFFFFFFPFGGSMVEIWTHYCENSPGLICRSA